MNQVPEPPEMPRQVGAPGRLAAVLLLLAIVPAAALAGVLDDQARRSVLHVALTFGLLILAFRLIGKRELSRLSPFELVTLMLIPEILSNSVQAQGNLLPSISGLSAILLLVVGTSAMSHRFPGVQRALEPSPSVLVANGKLLEQNMNVERIAPDELFSEMRKQGLASLRDIRYAVLEVGGNITFVAKAPQPHASGDSDPRPD